VTGSLKVAGWAGTARTVAGGGAGEQKFDLGVGCSKWCGSARTGWPVCWLGVRRRLLKTGCDGGKLRGKVAADPCQLAAEMRCWQRRQRLITTVVLRVGLLVFLLSLSTVLHFPMCYYRAGVVLASFVQGGPASGSVEISATPVY
jgi:hypothetical protein